MYSDKKLLQELHKFYKEHKRIPTTRELKKPNTTTYRNRFGSLKNALIQAGLPVDDMVSRPYSYSDEKLLDLLKVACIKLGRIPKYSDFTKKGQFKNFPHVKTFELRFGSFQKAIELSGVLDIEFNDHVDDIIEKGERVMEQGIRPGRYQSVLQGNITVTSGGRPVTLKKGGIVYLNEDDLASIIHSEIIQKGYLIPTETDPTVVALTNFYTDEQIEELIKTAENTEVMAEALRNITSIVTVDRFIHAMRVLDSPQSFVTVGEVRLQELKDAESPDAMPIPEEGENE